jgi:hypothetical protein
MKLVSNGCKMCGEVHPLDELGYCNYCRPDVVEHLIKQLEKPILLWRSTAGDFDEGPRNLRYRAEREIIRIVAST